MDNMTNIDSIYKQINKKIRLYENGPASDLLKNYGLNYKIIFGLSVLNIKKIAKEFLPQNDLADFLIQKDIRETRILATFLYEPENISFSKAIEISNYTNDIEFAEQVVVNLFSKLNFAGELADKLIYSDNEYKISAGFILISKIITKTDEQKHTDIEKYIKSAEVYSQTQIIHIAKSIARALRNIAKISPDTKNKIIQVCNKIKSESHKFSDLIYEEVVPLI